MKKNHHVSGETLVCESEYLFCFSYLMVSKDLPSFIIFVAICMPFLSCEQILQKQIKLKKVFKFQLIWTMKIILRI